MLRKAIGIGLTLVMAFSLAALAQDSEQKGETAMIPGYPIPFPTALLAANQPERSIKVVAHRGAKKFAPDNTLPAIAAAMAMGMDFVELDVRTTADGHLVLMHDGTVDGRTDGTGAVRDLTLEQIKKLDAGVKFSPDFKGTEVPTFEQALALMTGKIGLYLDAKDVDPEAAAELLVKYDMADKTVVYCDFMSAKDWIKANEAIRPMPEVGNVQTLNLALRAVPQLKVVAGSWQNVTPEVVQAIHDKGLEWFVDIQGGDENYDKIAKAIEAGLDGIQTDNPDWVLDVIAGRIPQ